MSIYQQGDKLVVTAYGKSVRVSKDESASGMVGLEILGPNGGVQATVVHVPVAELAAAMRDMTDSS
jgi:hypothetical protein